MGEQAIVVEGEDRRKWEQLVQTEDTQLEISYYLKLKRKK
jgi:hypothetical protein